MVDLHIVYSSKILAESGALVVWYFDTLEAEKYEFSEKAILDAFENGSAFNCLQYSSVPRSKGGFLGGLKTHLVPCSPESK